MTTKYKYTPVDHSDDDHKIALVDSILNTYENLDDALLAFKKCYGQVALYHYDSDDASYAVTVSLLTPAFLKDMFAVKQLHDNVIQAKQALYTFTEEQTL